MVNITRLFLTMLLRSDFSLWDASGHTQARCNDVLAMLYAWGALNGGGTNGFHQFHSVENQQLQKSSLRSLELKLKMKP
jgi:hypothetical protein